MLTSTRTIWFLKIKWGLSEFSPMHIKNMYFSAGMRDKFTRRPQQRIGKNAVKLSKNTICDCFRSPPKMVIRWPLLISPTEWYRVMVILVCPAATQSNFDVIPNLNFDVCRETKDFLLLHAYERLTIKTQWIIFFYFLYLLCRNMILQEETPVIEMLPSRTATGCKFNENK